MERLTVEGRTADLENGKNKATCPFCNVRTAFQFRYDGLMVEYRSKCPHVREVTRNYGPVMVFFQCSVDGL
jgi:hypothetical protein